MSPRAEFATVILVAFGYFILGGVLTVLTPGARTPISDSGLHSLIVYELIATTALGAFLFVRGWRLQQLGFTPSLRDTGVGVVLAVAGYASFAAVWQISSSSLLGLGSESSGLVAPPIRVTTVLAITVLNPIFEEIFVCGYLITALKTARSPLFAVNISVGVRLLYHLYQGAVGVISIVPLGLIFAHWYARTGRLWPIVIAHAILDLVGLWPYVG